MAYLFLVIAVLTIAIQNVLVGFYNKKVVNSTPCVLTLFFSIITIFGFLCLAKFQLFKYGIHWPTLICGLAAGIMCSLHFVFIQLAMKTGPVSLTSLFVSYSLLIPTIFSMVYKGEPVYITFFIGLPLLIASIALTNKKETNKKKKQKVNFAWIIFVIIAVITNGCFSVCSTIQQTEMGKYLKIAPDGYRNEFIILAMAVVIVFNLIMMFARKTDRERIKPSLQKGWYIALANGIAYFLIQYSMLTSQSVTYSAQLPLSIYFPVVSAGSLVLTLIGSVIVLKERLSLKQWIGVGIGVIAIVVFNLNFSPIPIAIPRWYPPWVSK